MIAWLALIPAVFLAMLAMDWLEERLVPNADRARRGPRKPDSLRRPNHANRTSAAVPVPARHLRPVPNAETRSWPGEPLRSGVQQLDEPGLLEVLADDPADVRVLRIVAPR